MEKNYWVIRQGEANSYADKAYQNKCVAISWKEFDQDLSKYKKLEQAEFLGKVVPALKKIYKNKTDKYCAGSARQIYKFLVLVKPGDVVIVPANSEGLKYFGVVRSDYYYAAEEKFFPARHRRDVEWVAEIHKNSFSEDLRNSTGSIMTIFNVSKHADEIEGLIGGKITSFIGQNISDIKDFGMESHLEDFIAENWDKIDRFKDYEIYQEEGELLGQQYNTNIGRIDILARRKDQKEWLVIELKKGRSADDVLGQTLRYIGWVSENEAKKGEKVRGLIIAGEQDEKLGYGLKAVGDIDFMTYSVNFELHPRKK